MYPPMRPCPSDEELVRLLSGAEDPALREHLAACASCRPRWEGLEEAYARPAPSPALEGRVREALSPFLARPRRLRYAWAAAAALLLVLGLWRRGKEGAPPVPPSAPESPVLDEWAFGRTGQAVLEPGSKGRREGTDLLLEAGGLWVESSGDPVRIRVSGWDGCLVLEDAAALIRMRAPKPSAWIAEAWAGPEAEPAVLVARGKVRGPAGREWVTGAEVPADPRGWRMLPGGLFRERTLELAGEGAGVVEVLVRKRSREAEAALIFPCAGSGWQAPLGVQLPSDGRWIRIRLELGGRSARIQAGDREYLRASGPGLAGTFYACPAPAVPTLRVFGGEVEVAEARWRR